MSASANHMKICASVPRNPWKFSVISITMSICMTVLTLPQMFAAITTPFSTAMSLNPDIMNSSAIMIITIQLSILQRSPRQIIAEHTRSLSASGSMNLPNVVT